MKTVSDIEHMRKKFGASAINRDMFIYCFDRPIYLEGVSDYDMQDLANMVESKLKKKYPDSADEFFALWSKDDATNEEYEIMAVEYNNIWNEYWELLEKFGKQLEERH